MTTNIARGDDVEGLVTTTKNDSATLTAACASPAALIEDFVTIKTFQPS
jgi:hypothetical protein